MNKEPKLNKRIRKGDKVIVISGNFRGQTGTVLSRTGDKVIVQGLNVRKRHIKRSQASPKGGIIELEKPLHASNLRACTTDDKPVKLRVRHNHDGNRELYYQVDGEDILYRSIKQTKI